jgi:hypothetical protein
MARKWNNQGGSNFDAFSGKYKKPKDYQNIPKFEDLIESNTTSFNYKIPPKPTPQLGMFGDEIWTYTPIDDTPIDDTRQISPIKPFKDLTPKDPTIPKIPEKIPNPSIPKVDPVSKSTDLLPYNVTNEYEVVVKFGSLVLRISSGQAYAARQMINNARYDFSLVIKSSEAILFTGLPASVPASTLTLISIADSAKNPIYSLYSWILNNISIATNNDATGADPVLSKLVIVEYGARLPSTQFVFNGKTYGLFYAKGIQPDQICLNATNKVFTFEPSKKDDPKWIVTYPGEILPLCLDLKLQIVSIKLFPDTLTAIRRGSGDSFVIRIARDATIDQLASSLEVAIQITSAELLPSSQELDPALYATTNIDGPIDGNIQIWTTIPAQEEFIDVLIEPLNAPDKVDPEPLKVEITGSWEPGAKPDYSINPLFSEVVMTVNPNKPIVTLSTDRTSVFPQDGDDGKFFVILSLDQAFSSPLSVTVEFDGTALYADYTVNDSPSSFVLIAVIPAGQIQYNIEIKPNLTPVFLTDRTIIPTIKSSDDYILGDPYSLDLTISSTLVLKPRLSMRSDKNWLEAGEILTVNIRRRFDTDKRDAAILAGYGVSIDTSPLTVNVYTYVDDNQTGIDRLVTIPTGGETSFTLTAASFGSAGAAFYESNEYTIESGDFLSGILDEDVVAPIYDLSPIAGYTHNRYVFVDLHRDKWANINNLNTSWFSWHRSGNQSTLTPNPPIFGGTVFRNESTTFANWGSTYEFVQRFITQTHSLQNEISAPPPFFNTNSYSDTVNISPTVDLSIYRLVTGLTTGPDGVTPCPPFAEPYSTEFPFVVISAGNTFPKPGSNPYLYPAGNIGFNNNEPAVWIYAYRNSRIYTESISGQITPDPPTIPKFRSTWPEDPDWFDANP